MKRLPLALATPATIFLALTLTACGDDVTKVTETGASVTAVESEANLPDCGSDNNGSFVIAQDKQKVFVCYSESWFTLNGNDGSPAQSTTADSAATGKKGADGKNGTNGTNGTSCTGVAFESGDSTGFKIVCGKDTLGVILNGRDGIDGKNGRHGMIRGLASELVKKMKRGINSAVFQSPGTKFFKGFSDNGFVSDWGTWADQTNYNKMEKKHFKILAEKGFDHIRFQIQWHTHFTGDSSKCQIDPEYMKQIKWAVENTIQNGMIATVNEHNLLMQQEQTAQNASNGLTYAKISPCEKAIYKQLAESMSEYSPNSLIIELPNEPTSDAFITAEQWNNLADSLINIIHGVDPARVIIVGGRYNYDKSRLAELKMDNPDGLLMASFHYYEPFYFTGGGCSMATQPDTVNCGKMKWNANVAQRKTIYNDFKAVSDWSKTKGMPVYLGEYGTVNFVKDKTSAEKWLTAVTQIADMFGFGTAMHELGSDYGIYNLKNDKWVDYKVRAIFDPQYDMTLDPDDYQIQDYQATLIEDFDDAAYPTNTYFGGNYWYIYASNVTARNASNVKYPTAGISDFLYNNAYLASVNGSVYELHKSFYAVFSVEASGNNKYPAFGLGINIPNSKKDMSSIKAISFFAWAPGVLKAGKVKFVLRTAYSESLKQDPSDWVGDFSKEIQLSSSWNEYIVWLDDLIPEPYSKLDTLQADWFDHNDDVTALVFQSSADITPQTNDVITWYIDNIKIYK